METMESQRNFDEYYDLDTEEMFNSTPPIEKSTPTTSPITETSTKSTTATTKTSTTTTKISTTTTTKISTKTTAISTKTSTTTISTTTTSVTPALEDHSMDTSMAPNTLNPREARAKASKDRLKAMLVLRTPRPAETALKYQYNSTNVGVKFYWLIFLLKLTD